ncbi:hypothetical protein GCM10008018_45300 [Paenibacillus marchantiophytorum]|uniref:Uncharacterized protein n=1 Tax=Paenibacillus marchantiophytorum TaxID=1619310 RepID=A0ABQ1F032_9BACL|nr:hypothetical protein [Paenibacillus marchantiophytorum]GFZ93806.1 hypothetical protein GCM10008018_45300 [Paenibacillus marchantiophytorum]
MCIQNLMKRGYGKVTAGGILFKGKRFTCPRAIREQWFERAMLEKEWRVKVVFKPENSAIIYIPDGMGDLEPCNTIATNNTIEDIKLQRYFQSIQKLKSLREVMKKQKVYRRHNKKKRLLWKS